MLFLVSLFVLVSQQLVTAQTFTPLTPWWLGGTPATCDVASDAGKSWRNSCDEWCKCIELPSGDMTYECWRERKEITCMSTVERQRLLDAWIEISTPGHELYDSYENLIGLHTSANFGTIHDTAWFLPWHRWFSLEMENLLRQVDCRITLPWWDWTKKTTTWQTNAPFLDSPSWYGEDGNPSSVTTGPFATPGWSLPVTGGPLTRNFNGNMPAYPLLSTVLGIGSGSYNSFSDQLEGVHNTPHVRISGTMVTGESPRAPEFFLHHNMIDRMWSVWQSYSPAHLSSYGSFDPDATMPYAYGVTPNHVMDLAHQVSAAGDCARVRYVRYSTRVTGQPLFLLRSCYLVPVSFSGMVSLDTLQRGLSLLPREELQAIRQVRLAPLTDNEKQHLVGLSRKGENGEQDAAEATEKMESFQAAADEYYGGAQTVEPEQLKKQADGTWGGNPEYGGISYELGLDVEEAWERILSNPQVYEQLLKEQREVEVDAGVPSVVDDCCDKCGPDEACKIDRNGCECWTPATNELKGLQLPDLRPPAVYPRDPTTAGEAVQGRDAVLLSPPDVATSGDSLCCKKKGGRRVCRKCQV